MLRFETIQKPTLLLNQARCQANIARMAEKARQNRVRFRPHFKTHQSVAIGEWFRAQGVEAITVSSLDMANYFADHGWNDITLAFSLNWRQIEAIDSLAARVHLGLLFESVESVGYAARHLTHSVAGWIKIDVGAHRTGVPYANAGQVAVIAQAMAQSSTIHVMGLLTHAGHAYHPTAQSTVLSIYQASVQNLKGLAHHLAQAGYPEVQLSVGDTPACSMVPDLLGVDEIRPGNFVLYDAMQVQIGSCQEEDIAVGVACPVVARHAERNEIVIYGGAIHLSKESMRLDGHPCYGLVALPAPDGWGKAMVGAYVSSLSQEHGVVKVTPEQFDRIHLGDLLIVLPVHSCLVVSCLQKYLTLDGEVIQTFRDPIG
jgi:D-serine deaminase-like pyridoxal phosphate-dependent protein